MKTKAKLLRGYVWFDRLLRVANMSPAELNNKFYANEYGEKTGLPNRWRRGKSSPGPVSVSKFSVIFPGTEKIYNDPLFTFLGDGRINWRKAKECIKNIESIWGGETKRFSTISCQSNYYACRINDMKSNERYALVRRHPLDFLSALLVILVRSGSSNHKCRFCQINKKRFALCLEDSINGCQFGAYQSLLAECVDEVAKKSGIEIRLNKFPRKK